VIPLTIIIMTSSTIGIATINFAPKLFTEVGYGPVYVGLTAGLFMMGSAAGGIIGGTIGDRVGQRVAIFSGMIGAIIPLYLYIPAGDPWRFALLLLSGFFAGMPHSVLVIITQGLIPGRRAFASGLILGLMFFSGAVGSYMLGLLADEVGLAIALQALVLLPIIAAMATVILPGRSKSG
jgi:FSR family fosmidomycin resistance protein-like MFS transporter